MYECHFVICGSSRKKHFVYAQEQQQRVFRPTCIAFVAIYKNNGFHLMKHRWPKSHCAKPPALLHGDNKEIKQRLLNP